MQSINLVKDEAFDLTKDFPGLTKVNFAGGWDVSGPGADDFDLDLIAIPLVNGKVRGTTEQERYRSIAFYANKAVEGLVLDKDNRTGEGDGDDETIAIDLAAIPAEVDKVMLYINIYEGAAKNQRFSQVDSSFVRLYNPADKSELCKYELKSDFKRYNAVAVGELYRNGAEWEFKAKGEGFDGDVAALVAKYI